MNLAWMVSRLRRMSVSEVMHRAYRIGRHTVERGIPAFGRPPGPSGATLAERHWFLDLNDRETVRRTVLGQLGWSERTAQNLLAHRFSFFALQQHSFGNVIRWNRDYKNQRDAPGGFGPLLDYRDFARYGDIKYVWEHNRHHHLVELSKAWYLTGDETYASEVVAQVESWIAECPYPQGVQWSSSLESALRVLNWLFALRFLLAGDAIPRSLTPEIQRAWLHMLHQHLWFINRNLSRHSSANNHLIGEAAGLFVGALLIEVPESTAWVRRAQAILEREVLAQVWPDGVTKEQTTAYQTFVFDFLFIAARLGALNNRPFSRSFTARAERMAEFVRALIDERGEIPSIGDDDEGHVVILCHSPGFRKCRSLLDTAALGFNRPDLRIGEGAVDEKTFWLTGQASGPTGRGSKGNPRNDFPDGGYYILRGQEANVIVDCGPLGYLSIAAHGHADALSILLDYKGRPFLVDPGTYIYHTDRFWRDYFRGTGAHNTIQVDGEDQSVIGGSFLWLHHARATLLERRPDGVRGQHDGYMRLADPVMHVRSVQLDMAARTILVADQLECRGAHSVDVLWHLHPECRCRVIDGMVQVEHAGAAISIEPETGSGALTLHCGDINPPLGWYSAGIDRKVPSTTIRVSTKIKGPTSYRTRIHLV